MNKDNRQNIVVFGQEYNSECFCSATAEDIIEEAYEKFRTSSEPDIEYVLSILNNVSTAWSNSEYYLRKKAKELLLEITSFGSEMIDNGLDRISALCSIDRLYRKINLELGSFDYLKNKDKSEEANLSEDSDKKIKARPKGIILHINSGDLFFDIIDSWLLGIITKNINILKVDIEIIPFILLFLESIKEFDPTGIIWTNQAVLYWNDFDDKINEIFFNKDLTILFQSNKKLLDYYKTGINKDTKLIDNSLKYSFAIVEGKSLKSDLLSSVINGLAFDICQWNQMSSYSPHVVYIIDKDLKTSHQLIEALFDEMIVVGEELPLGNLSFDEKVKIRKLREISRMMQVKGEGRLVCPEDFSFTLILDYNPAFKLSCLNRTLFIKRVSNLDNLMELLIPLEGNIQSVSLFLSDEMKSVCEKELLKLGVKHFSTIGKSVCEIDEIPKNGLFLIRELTDLIYFGE